MYPLFAGEPCGKFLESIAATWSPQGSFHHVGFVVGSIQETVESFMKSLEADWDGVIVHDPEQKVRVACLQSANPADPLFELIEPVAENSPVTAPVKRGGGLHHLCYIVDSIDEHLARSEEQCAIIVRRPTPAGVLGRRRIAWVYTRDQLLIEYLER
jgi:methylmalonyl-CoA/ethylmalonyl-CoA epimerase